MYKQKKKIGDKNEIRPYSFSDLHATQNFWCSIRDVKDSKRP